LSDVLTATLNKNWETVQWLASCYTLFS